MNQPAEEQASERRGEATLLVNEQRIPVGADTDLRVLIDQIVHAVMMGGEFVHIEGRHGRQYDVLVTPSTQVMLRMEGVPGDPQDTGPPWATGSDLEY